MITCDEIIVVMHILSTQMTNTLSRNVTKSWYRKKSDKTSYKTLTEAKPLCIRFNKIDGFIRI